MAAPWGTSRSSNHEFEDGTGDGDDHASASARSVGPASVTSSAAAVPALPTSALASRSE